MGSSFSQVPAHFQRSSKEVLHMVSTDTTQFYIHSCQSCEKELTYLGICYVSVLVDIMFVGLKISAVTVSNRGCREKIITLLPRSLLLAISEGVLPCFLCLIIQLYFKLSFHALAEQIHIFSVFISNCFFD